MLSLQAVQGFQYSAVVSTLNIYLVFQAIALSLKDSETSAAHLMNPAPSANYKRKEKSSVQDVSVKKGRKSVSIIRAGDLNKISMNQFTFYFV